MPRRFVVLGDVVDSQEIEDRAGFQRTLGEALAAVNEELGAVPAPFRLQKGIDEFGGVLGGPAGAYGAIRTVHERVRPRRVTFALVWGTVDVGAASDDVTAMDGPAFHEADALLAEAKGAGLAVRLAVDGSPLETAVEDEMNLLLERRADWTARQAEVAAAYASAGSQRAVAERLGVSPATVSGSLRASGAKRVLRYERRLAGVLERFGERLA